MSNGPTPPQIAQVQLNLKRMQAFNDYVYNQGQSRVLNAYFLLSEQDNSDPGLTIGLNIFEGLFWAVGSELGPIGNFLASFLSGMVSWWGDRSAAQPEYDLRQPNDSVTKDFRSCGFATCNL